MMKKLLISVLVVAVLLMLTSCRLNTVSGADKGNNSQGTEDNITEPVANPIDDKETQDQENQDTTEDDEFVWKTFLWSSDSQGMELEKREHEFTFTEEPDAVKKAHAIMEILISKGANKEYINTIPETTKVLSIELDGTTIVLDLSSEFETENVGGSTGVIMAITPIIYSITEIEDVDSIFIKIDGKVVEDFKGHVSLDSKMSRNES